MVWSREKVEERPPPSVILPRLYLGAESDVTQEQLACLGISYVLTVSRCSPQPSFLPCSRYLRIPIDDSLWDDLLPWIPQALHFIDAAMSSGASVLVHCAAGISRSPTLAVAYVMYSLGMDLDHAYRFVKERRPSISPNFNFLGQLQHFQDILSQKASSGHLLAQQINTFPPSASDDITHIQTSQKMNHEAAGFTSIATEDKRDHKDTVNHTDKIQQRNIHSDRNKNQPLQTPHLTLCQIQKQVRTASKVSAPRPQEPSKHLTKLTQIRVPSGSASLLEKRKNLTLSLTPLGISSSCTSGRQQAEDATLPRMFQNSRSVRRPEAETPRPGDTHQEQSPSHNNCRDEVQSQGMLSPFSLTLNKLLGWGERVLLGGVFVHPVRIGQSALP